MVGLRGFSCGYEREKSQRHQEKSRVEGEVLWSGLSVSMGAEQGLERERVVRIAGDEEEGSIAQAREASELESSGKGMTGACHTEEP